MSAIQLNLEALANKFDIFLIDQFGVLVNGNGAYSFAPVALSKLAALGKRIIILSNSGKRSAPNIARLVALGFARDSFETILSSGEVAFEYLKSQIGVTIKPETEVLVVSRDNDFSSIEGLPLHLTQTPEDANLIILAGSQGDVRELNTYKALLENPAHRGVLCLCTNPDMNMLTPSGQKFGAGRIAKMYQEMGGDVKWIGKPHAMIYEAAFQLLGQPARARVLCVGDSPAHDIKGARDAGFMSALVRTGIYADMNDLDLAEICKKIDTRPDFILPKFAFSH